MKLGVPHTFRLELWEREGEVEFLVESEGYWFRSTAERVARKNPPGQNQRWYIRGPADYD